MDPVGVASKIFVSRLNIIEQFLHIFEKHCERTDVMLGGLGILGVFDVFGPPAFGVASISELSADSTVGFGDCHNWPPDLSLSCEKGGHSKCPLIRVRHSPQRKKPGDEPGFFYLQRPATRPPSSVFSHAAGIAAGPQRLFIFPTIAQKTARETAVYNLQFHPVSKIFSHGRKKTKERRIKAFHLGANVSRFHLPEYVRLGRIRKMPVVDFR